MYLARHGQTESNLLNRYSGFSSEPVTRVGRAQMMDLGTRLKTCGIAEIWTSAMARARESADVVSRILGLPVHVDPRLNEMGLGAWQGLTEAEVGQIFPEEYKIWCTAPDRLDLEGRESLLALSDRVNLAVVDAAGRPRPVLCITHVAPIRVAVIRALGLPLRYYRRVHVGNGDCLVIAGNQIGATRLGEKHSLRDDLPPCETEGWMS